MDKETKDVIKEDLEELKDAAIKVSKSASSAGAKEIKTVTEKAKKTAKKSSTKVKDFFKSTKTHTFIQLYDQEISEDDIIDKIKTKYYDEGHTELVKELNLYIKPEDNAVYYVVNGVSHGKVDIR